MFYTNNYKLTPTDQFKSITKILGDFTWVTIQMCVLL